LLLDAEVARLVRHCPTGLFAACSSPARHREIRVLHEEHPILSKTRRFVPDIDDDMTEIDVSPAVEGLVVDGSRGMYRVETPEGTLRCEIRGWLRKQFAYAQTSGAPPRDSVQRAKARDHAPVAVGDRVRVLVTGRGTGMIEEIAMRGESRVESEK
jgi:hypothetical protein